METSTTDKLAFITEELSKLKEQGLYINIRTIESAQGAWLMVDGRRALNFCSNNYLGLANHPHLRDSAKRAIDTYGIGPAAVRTIAGTMDLHLELEQRLAKFKGAEAALTLQSGFTANLAVVPTLLGQDDALVSDELNHASIIDAIRLCKAQRFIYKHLDMVDLDAKLQQAVGSGAKRILIITDGVFSMDGDVAPLDKIADLADRYNAMTMVDDAHGEGVLGRGGRGIVDHFHLHGRVDIEVGTLSKAFGVVGGCVAGKGLVVEYLRQRARPNLFSSAMTVPDVAACMAAIDILEGSTELVDRLWGNTRYFKAEMRTLGFDTGNSTTPITPVLLGEAPVAKEFSRRLFDRNVFAMAIGFPTVPMGKARIRVMISASHSQEDLNYGLEAFKAVGKEMGVI